MDSLSGATLLKSNGSQVSAESALADKVSASQCLHSVKEQKGLKVFYDALKSPSHEIRNRSIGPSTHLHAQY